MWFVTQEGLNRYTGNELENFRYSSNNPNSLPTNTISELTEDHSGRIWLATREAGIVFYDPIDESFKAFLSNPNDRNTPYSNDVRSIFTDSRGVLWLGYNGAFSSFSSKESKFHHYVPSNMDLPPTGEISAFAETEDGNIWIATQQSGLIRLNPTTNNWELATPPNELESFSDLGWITDLKVDKKGRLWIGTRERGVYFLDINTFNLESFRHSAEDRNSLSSDRVTNIYQDNDLNIWIATESGLSLFSEAGKNFYRYSTFNTNLPEDLVISIYQSREGKYWVGTMSELASGMKTNFEKYDQTRSSLSNNSVNAFTETPDGSLWVGTDDGLNVQAYNETDFTWINESTSPYLSDSRVMSLLGEQDTLWVGTYSGGLNKLSLSTSETKVFKHSNLDGNSISANGITDIYRTSSGELLIGTYGGGVSVYHEGEEYFTNYQRDTINQNSISSNFVLDIFEDSLGLVWIGTENGLNRFDLQSRTFTRYFGSREKHNTFSSNIPWAFLEDSDGTLWIGTSGGGVNLWKLEDRKSNKVNIVQLSDYISLPSANIYGIQEDSTRRVWISHGKGITSVQLDTFEVHHYGIRDGLQANEFTLGASYKMSDGKLLFGSVRGYNGFYPSQIKADRVPPKVSISQILVMDERRDFGAPYNQLKSIDLEYQDQMVSIEFFAADYANPDLLNYAYKLEGLNPDWLISPDSRIARFTTLPPGSYTLRLAAASPDGTWNWDGASIDINVAPPPWQSPAAYALYMVFVAFSIYYYWSRQRRKELEAIERQRELEEKVEERTRDLEIARNIAEDATKAKSDFLATMSHEIRTPMHGIIGMTQLLLHTNLSNQQKQFANAAKSSGESLLSLINEILDFSKIEAAKVDIENVEFDLTNLMDDICYLQSEPASKSGIDLNNICHPATPKSLIGDPTKTRQVVMNLVTNAIKFTPEGNVNVRVEPTFPPADRTKCVAIITVEDTGIGMDSATQSRVFEPFTQADASTTRKYGGTGLGLSISRKYIELMGGDIAVRSSPGKGTKITVTLPFQIAPSPKRSVSKLVYKTARAYTNNLYTFEMIESHLRRFGISCARGLQEELPVFAPPDEEIIFVDYDEELIDLISRNPRSESLREQTVLLVGLHNKPTVDVTAKWATTTKPITSLSLYDCLSSTSCNKNRSVRGANTNHSLSGKNERKASILVAEDVSTNQAIIREMLQILGHSVDIAENGESALGKYFSGSYDLIFMDCQMPIVDGYTATRRIREHEHCNDLSMTPIIALTAGSDVQDRERCKIAGMNDYIAKPFSIDEIAASIETYAKSIDQRETESPDRNEIHSKTDISEVAIVDRNILDGLRDIERQTGKLLIPELLDGYIEQMIGKLEELHSSINQMNYELIYQHSHAIKSMSANLGAEHVKEISAQIELEGRKKRGTALAELFNELESAYNQFVESFRSEVIENT